MARGSAPTPGEQVMEKFQYLKRTRSRRLTLPGTKYTFVCVLLLLGRLQLHVAPGVKDLDIS